MIVSLSAILNHSLEERHLNILCKFQGQNMEGEGWGGGGWGKKVFTIFAIVPNLISMSFISNLYTSVSLNSSSVIPSSFSSSSSFEVSWERSDD